MACLTTKRGYGNAHQRERARWAPIVAEGGASCARCGRPIMPGSRWDLGHHDRDRSIYAGPEHRRCNRATAGRRARVIVAIPTEPAREW
jgi:hypothetical protein